MKRNWIAIALFCGLGARVFAQAELKGTPTELNELLPHLPKTVFVGGEAVVKAQADPSFYVVVRALVQRPDG